MTNEEFNKKWGESAYVAALNDKEKYKEYIDDCFLMYETEGFCKTFESPYEAFADCNGMAFKAIRRMTTDDGFELDSLPAWCIELENGRRIEALPEEICKIERDER